MNKINRFFWHCSGADISLLEKCPTENSKYVGIGGAIFFTGVFAALAAMYALLTVFNNYWIAAILGLVWGVMIFNLDRFIVSSMRKDGRFFRELISASPRILLAVLISIVIAKPLELKIFEKEIEPELIVMEQQAYTRQEEEVKSRFEPALNQIQQRIDALKSEILVKEKQRNELVRLAQEEADGTGGSMQKNLGPIYKVKKADAEKAGEELNQLSTRNQKLIAQSYADLHHQDSLMAAEIKSLEQKRLDGPAARLEALNRISKQSSAIWWANIFIIFLFIILETAPVLVKLISNKGPYDNLLKIEEHKFTAKEIENIASTSAETKERTVSMPHTEKNYVSNRLDAELQ